MAPDGNVTPGFDTLGNAIWFGIVTFSTVGYGDFAPKTWLGKFISTLGIGSGMLWFAMPITIVGSTFQMEWGRRNLRAFAEALQTELLEHGLMTHDLVCAFSPELPSRSPSSPSAPYGPAQYKKFILIDTDQDGELDEKEFSEYIMSDKPLPRTLTLTLRNPNPNPN